MRKERLEPAGVIYPISECMDCILYFVYFKFYFITSWVRFHLLDKSLFCSLKTSPELFINLYCFSVYISCWFAMILIIRFA